MMAADALTALKNCMNCTVQKIEIGKNVDIDNSIGDESQHKYSGIKLKRLQVSSNIWNVREKSEMYAVRNKYSF